MNSCQKCGKCCAGVLLLSDEEVYIIKKYIKKHNIQIVNRQSILQDYVDVCPFLSKENKCNIYEVRPSMCKRFKCFEANNSDLNYEKLKIVHMQKTFYNTEYCPEVDLSYITSEYEIKKQDYINKKRSGNNDLENNKNQNHRRRKKK